MTPLYPASHLTALPRRFLDRYAQPNIRLPARFVSPKFCAGLRKDYPGGPRPVSRSESQATPCIRWNARKEVAPPQLFPLFIFCCQKALIPGMDPMIVGVVLAAGGALITLAGVVPARTIWHAQRMWPKAYGSIIESRLLEEEDPEGGTDYSSEITYRYDVEETGYYGRGIGLYEMTFSLGSGEQPAKQAVSNYRKGQSVMVYYDPNRPTRSALELELPGLFFLMAVVGPMLVLTGIAMFWNS